MNVLFCNGQVYAWRSWGAWYVRNPNPIAAQHIVRAGLESVADAVWGGDE